MKRIVLTAVLLFTVMLCVRTFAQTASSSGPVSPDPGNVTIPTVTRAASDQKFDPNFGIPSPDVANKSRNVVNPETAKWVTSLLILVSLVPIAFAIRQSIKRSSLLPIAVALSGAAGVFAEVYTDVLGAVYWSNAPGSFATRTIFHLFGRDMSFIPVSAWISFGACLTYSCFAVISGRPKTKWLWCVFLLAGLLDWAFEEPLLAIGGSYVYYGNQPLILLRFPWWWALMNAGGLFLPAAIAFRYRESLRGPGALVMFFVTPAAFMAFYGFCSWPTFCVINGHFPWLITQLSGVFGLAVATIATAGTIHLVLRRNPFDLEAGEPEETSESVVEERMRKSLVVS